MSSTSKTVVVGMSGGVDSSVSALLLKQQGHRVIGLFMKNWEEKDEQGVCQASKEYEDVVCVCDQIGIPCYSVNFTQRYWDDVFCEFLKEFELGRTPNPDILCNREIKFKAMFNKAIEYGADYMATGHYCQSVIKDGMQCLAKGVDPGKDQSYFLYTVKADTLKQVVFPLGSLLKSDVRKIAKEHGLATSEKKDSTGICFIGKRDFKEFLSKYLAIQPGNFENLKGEKVGRHEGIAYYTLGQRKGMGIGGAGEAWYVIGKDIARNVVLVDQGARHPALYCDELTAVNLTWIVDQPPCSSFPFQCQSKVRYRQPDQNCRIVQIENNKAHVTFEIPQRAVTPGQSIVFYDGEHCLGGGIIDEVGPSYHARRLQLPAVVSS
jgi:tRNA-uridine 2-sulfurtransferase